MLTIGRFADASGLTVRALRHYDEIGLLRPAQVDPVTGYRYYDSAQLEDAVTIRRLRALELPLDDIGQLLAADAATFRNHLAAHGYRVAEEARDKHSLLLELAALVEGGDAPLPIDVRHEPALRLAALIRQLEQDQVAAGVREMARAVRVSLDRCGVEATGPPTAVFRSGDRERSHLVEAGWPIGLEADCDEQVATYSYPAAPAATYDYTGDLEQLDPIAQRFIATVLGQGHRFAQPIRIVYAADDRARLVWPLASR
jgi:DNA-binding transcriptional MerR regulator